MKITKIETPKNTVCVGCLPVGSCWEYTPMNLPGHPSPVVGMTVERNGHCFFLNLETGRGMGISENAKVIPVDAFMNYREKNV